MRQILRGQTTTRRDGRFGSCRGQSLIESVFVIFTLLAMVLFIVEMGRIMLAEEYLTGVLKRRRVWRLSTTGPKRMLRITLHIIRPARLPEAQPRQD